MKQFDAITYLDGETVPDLGTWECANYNISMTTGMQIRQYYGLSSDIGKLPVVSSCPKYRNILGSGSTALCVDTATLYIYESHSDKWYKQ